MEVKLPKNASVISAKQAAPLKDSKEDILISLNQPIGTPPLSSLSRNCKSAAIVVSDNTRPVPYKGENGLLYPIINILKKNNIREIKIIVACGTHHPMSRTELRDMLGDTISDENIHIINHSARDSKSLRYVGDTDRTKNVKVNSHYLDADLKILTGLVEPHFMAGFSGGRKAVCPGICSEDVIHVFHSASILNNESSRNLALEGNPCHDESLKIARMAGVDFIVNVTIDNQNRITGIFSGDIEMAHLAAVEHLKNYVIVQVNMLYDIVVIPSGEVGINHYQCAKAAVEAAKVIKPGGKIIIIGNLVDSNPLGSDDYRKVLKVLVQNGPKKFLKLITDEEWTFMHEQWQVQMWAKSFINIGSTNNIYTVATQLENCPEGTIPEINVAFLNDRLSREADLEYCERITQLTLDKIVSDFPNTSVLVLQDGPYTVPILEDKSVT